MGKNTGIEWTDHTWNPWQGCHRQSRGCEQCYMYREKERYGQDPTTVVRSKPATFNAPLSKKWSSPARVFACSWSDFFIKEADPWRDEAWNIIQRTPHLTYQIPTKRADRITECLPLDWGNGWPNVWLLVSIEDQLAADERLIYLRDIPAVVHGVSYEPAIGPWNPIRTYAGNMNINAPGWLDWVIAACESGPHAREASDDWFRQVRDQCQAAGVAFFLKQQVNYDNKLEKMPELDGKRWAQFPELRQ